MCLFAKNDKYYFPMPVPIDHRTITYIVCANSHFVWPTQGFKSALAFYILSTQTFKWPTEDCV